MASDKSWLDYALPGLSSGLSFLGGLFGDSWEAQAAHDQIQAQYDIANANLQAQKDTNNANALMARERNENAIQLQREMNSFNVDMWNKNNKYNSPQMQLERARAAGINPNVSLGSPVASSPVQQTSIPQLETPRSEAPLMQFNPLKGYSHSRLLEGLGKALEGLTRLPFYREQIQSARLNNEEKQIANDKAAYDFEKQKEADYMYGGNRFYQATDGSGRLLNTDEFDRLSDEDKKAFLDKDLPYVEIDGKKSPNYNRFNIPGITSRAAFEAYKDVMNLPNFMMNISADYSQNRLRQLVNEGKIKRNDVVNALIDTDKKNYDMVVQTLRKLKAVNKWNDNTYDIRKHILELQDKQLENAVNNDLKTWIDKIDKGDMSWSDWLKCALVVAATFR